MLPSAFLYMISAPPSDYDHDLCHLQGWQGNENNDPSQYVHFPLYVIILSVYDIVHNLVFKLSICKFIE